MFTDHLEIDTYENRQNLYSLKAYRLAGKTSIKCKNLTMNSIINMSRRYYESIQWRDL